MRREVGEITILVNNAGIVYVDGIMKITDDQVRRTLNVNLLGQIIVSDFNLISTAKLLL